MYGVNINTWKVDGIQVLNIFGQVKNGWASPEDKSCKIGSCDILPIGKVAKFQTTAVAPKARNVPLAMPHVIKIFIKF